MEKKTGNLMSGVGGVAFLALFLSPTGTFSSKPVPDTKTPDLAQVRPADNVKPVANDSVSGPWVAICDEYATNFDRGKDHVQIPTGASTHKIPEGAKDAAIEYTEHTQTQGGVTIEQKFQVRTHPVGDLTSCTKDHRDLEVLVATIPDPLASHFALYFDRDIEAIEKAAALSGFSISHYWLPWDSTDDPTALATSATRLAEWRSKAQEPGVLVFHNGNARRLLVFLVGETPTTGIQRIQFAHALWYAQELTSGHSSPEPSPVTLRINGPHFSSSLLGMKEVIRQNQIVSSKSTLHILSPYASSATLIKDFKKDFMETSGTPGSSYPDSWFVSLKFSSSDQENASICYLNRLGYEADDIALIGEDESAYSVATDQPDDDSSIACKGNGDTVRGRKRSAFLRLKYPRDLSSLRNKTDVSTPSDTEINGIKLPFWSVPVTLGERIHAVQDSPPSFAADQEASRNDHALQVIVSRLRQHKTRAVVIDASNNLDTLFLLEYFSRNLPNLRFATTDADEFEIGRLQNVELTGTVSISDLPLLRDSIQSKADDHISFASGDTEATYVSTSLLIDNILLNSTKLRNTDECATNSVVGRSGFILMTPQTTDLTFPCISSSNTIAPYLLRPESEQSVVEKSLISRSWSILLIVVITATYIHLAALFRSGALSRRRSIKYSPLRCSYPGDCGSYEAERVGMLFALNNHYLLLNFALATTTISLKNLYQAQGLAEFLLMSVLATLSMSITASYLLLRRCVSLNVLSRQSEQPEDHLPFNDYRRPIVYSAFYTLSTLVMWSLVLIGYFGPNTINIRYNSLRVALYPEGVSPLTPFIVISVAYIVYASVELAGIDWAARRRVWLRFRTAIDPTLHDLHTRLQQELKPFPRLELNTVVCTLAGTIVFGAVFDLRDSLSGFDGPFFKYWVLFFGFGASLLITTLTVLRAWSIWVKLKNILHWLQETGLKPAFSSLHKNDLPKLRVWDLGKREQDLTIHTKTIESLNGIANADAIHLARKALDRIRSAQVMGSQHSFEDARELSKQLNQPMDVALQYLGKNPVDCDECGNASQHYLALRFVALIRYSLLHIRNLYTFVVYGFASLAVCVASYPFEGKSNLSALLAILFAFILISIAIMFAQIQRDPILSLIEGSDAGKVSYLELGKHLVSIGGVPALIVLATQFPALGQIVLSWAKPALDLVK